MPRALPNGTMPVLVPPSLEHEWDREGSDVVEQHEKYRAFLLFGMPGSGKGTQGSALGKMPGYLHIASGEIFRQLNVLGQLGRKVAEYTSKGQLVPDDLTIRIWRTHIRLLKEQQIFQPKEHIIISDGLPRTYQQAQLLDDQLQVERIFYLKLRSDEEAIQRIKQRALKEKRVDDANEDVIRDRLITFRKNTENTLSFYDPSLVVDIDASQRPMEVLRDLAAAICECSCERDR